jgi:hypothetical protein
MSDEELPPDWWDRRAAMTLRVYRVANWDGRVSVAMSTETHRTVVRKEDIGRRPAPDDASDSFVDSTTVAHRQDPEENGAFVYVTSSLSDDERERTWSHAVSNLLIAVVNDEREGPWPEEDSERRRQAAVDERRREELREALDTGRIPWRRMVILVDGDAVEFDAVSLGECCAAVAVAAVDGIDIDIWSRRVELSELQLVHQ